VCWGAAAATLPYLALKLAWLAGSKVGVADPTVLADPAYMVANAITLLLDAFVVLLAFALTYDFGRRLPAWLLVPPLWVATGLLGPIVALLPMTLTLVDGRARGASQDALESWVYAVVYLGFSVQGLLSGWPSRCTRRAAGRRCCGGGSGPGRRARCCRCSGSWPAAWGRWPRWWRR